MHQPAGHITQALIITGTHITSPSILFYPTKHTHTHMKRHIKTSKEQKCAGIFLGYKFTKKVSRAKKIHTYMFFSRTSHQVRVSQNDEYPLQNEQ